MLVGGVFYYTTIFLTQNHISPTTTTYSFHTTHTLQALYQHISHQICITMYQSIHPTPMHTSLHVIFFVSCEKIIRVHICATLFCKSMCATYKVLISAFSTFQAFRNSLGLLWIFRHWLTALKTSCCMKNCMVKLALTGALTESTRGQWESYHLIEHNFYYNLSIYTSEF